MANSSQYPYANFSAFVGGRPTIIFENDADSFNFFSACLTFQQAAFSTIGVTTKGNLTFNFVIKDFSGNSEKRSVCVTSAQSIQSYNELLLQRDRQGLVNTDNNPYIISLDKAIESYRAILLKNLVIYINGLQTSKNTLQSQAS